MQLVLSFNLPFHFKFSRRELGRQAQVHPKLSAAWEQAIGGGWALLKGCAPLPGRRTGLSYLTEGTLNHLSMDLLR